jgi:preprotein translocase SecE subunit
MLLQVATALSSKIFTINDRVVVLPFVPEIKIIWSQPLTKTFTNCGIYFSTKYPGKVVPFPKRKKRTKKTKSFVKYTNKKANKVIYKNYHIIVSLDKRFLVCHNWYIMAIQITKDQNLVETLVSDKKIETSTGNSSAPAVNTKKQSFLKSVFVELGKVKWPSLRYVLNWSLLVILFTAGFSIILGGADHVFESGINFVNCSSPKGKARDLSTCSGEFVKKLFFVSTATK